VRTTPEVREQLRRYREWTVDTELLAQIKEEISILASDRRRSRPVQVPRPDWVRRKPAAKGGGGVAHAIAVLRKHARTVHYRPSA